MVKLKVFREVCAGKFCRIERGLSLGGTGLGFALTTTSHGGPGQ